jgi:putative metal-binding protein
MTIPLAFEKRSSTIQRIVTLTFAAVLLLSLLAVSRASAQCSDCDLDGFAGLEDCNDADPLVHPGAQEICDGRDTDCNGAVDDGICDLSCTRLARRSAELQLTSGPLLHTNPSIVWTGNEYGVVWDASDAGGPATGIFFNRLSAAGQKAGLDVQVSEGGEACRPSLVWTGMEFGVTWQDPCNGISEVYFARLGPDGGRIGDPVRVSDADPRTSSGPRLVWTGSGFGVAWTDTRDGNLEIYFALLNRSGLKVTQDLRITSANGASLFLDLVWTGSEFALAWTDFRDSTSGQSEVYFNRLSSSGAKLGTDIRVTSSAGASDFPSLAWTGSEFALAWHDSRTGTIQVYFTRLDEIGGKIQEDLQLSDPSLAASYPSATWNGEEFLVAWGDNDGDIVLRRLDAQGQELGEKVRLAHDLIGSDRPRLTPNGSGYGVTWGDQRVDFFQVFFARLGCNLANQLPVAVAGPDTRGECGVPGGITFHGGDSYDPDGEIVSYEWFIDYGSPTQTLLGSGKDLETSLPLGNFQVSLLVTDDSGAMATDDLVAMMEDHLPPFISVSLHPSVLWPPNHRMVDVHAEVSVSDFCSPWTTVLASVTSSEPDDATGAGDGTTTQDIQGGEIGAPDFDFLLRAERDGNGAGRSYAVTYQAVDVVGNMSFGSAEAAVPRLNSQLLADDLSLKLENGIAGPVVRWEAVPNATAYRVVRGILGQLRDTGEFIDLGEVECLVGQADQTDSAGVEDLDLPPLGTSFFYLVEYESAGSWTSYGTESASQERWIAPGTGCSASP